MASWDDITRIFDFYQAIVLANEDGTADAQMVEANSVMPDYMKKFLRDQY